MFEKLKNSINMHHLTLGVGVGLGAIGFGLLGLKAVLMYVYYSDPWYMVIWGFGVALAIFALYPLIQRLLRSRP